MADSIENRTANQSMESAEVKQRSGSVATIVSGVLSHAVVPLWVLTGAIFKLVEMTPANLPKGIVIAGKEAHVDLHVLLATLIALEFAAVAVMVFVPRLSRLAAIFMLSVFCLVLLYEMLVLGNYESCGCMGKTPVKPWQMLIIDGALLVALLFSSSLAWGTPRRTSKPGLRRAGWAAALLATIAGAAFTFARIMPERATTPRQFVQPIPNTSNDPTVNPAPLAVPPSWYIKTTAADWVGKPWREIELFQFMPKWPANMDSGKRYVVFYSRTCEHCEQMFWDHLLNPLDAPVTAIEIPDSKTQLTSSSGWEMPPTPCELMSLPLGCAWVITPPLTLTIEDGKVTCAVEGEGFEPCLGLQ